MTVSVALGDVTELDTESMVEVTTTRYRSPLSAEIVVAGVVYDALVAPLMLFHVEVAVDSAFCHWYVSASPYDVDAVVENVAVDPWLAVMLAGFAETFGAAPNLMTNTPLPPEPPAVRCFPVPPPARLSESQAPPPPPPPPVLAVPETPAVTPQLL